MPPPPIPADADLRHMPSYMIDVKSLLDSDLAAFGDPAANWYAVLTWCAALHQIPAGSLPDDDAKLAWLVRLGRDVKTWKKFREKGALRGWVLHADGRLYHQVVTEKVLDLLVKSRAGKAAVAAREAARLAQLTDNTQSSVIERSSSDAKSMQQNDNKGREGKGIEGKEREEGAGLTAGQPKNLPALFDASLAPIPPAKSAKRQRAAPKVPLDPAFQLNEEDRQYARDRHWDNRAIEQQFEKFKNHHIGKGNMWANWHLAWHTWVGNGYDFKGGRPGASATPGRADSAWEGMSSDLTPEDFHGRPR
jgi:hypothetical protein